MIHFVHMLDIYEVGPKIIDRLQEEGLVADAADLFALTEADLSGLERFGEKSAQNIIAAIAEKKHPPLDRFIASLGISNVGVETARDIALHFGSFENFWNSNVEDFDSIPNIGPAVGGKYQSVSLQRVIDQSDKKTVCQWRDAAINCSAKGWHLFRHDCRTDRYTNHTQS